MVTRDRLALAQRAIRSFADQTHANRELIVVTDGEEWYVRALQRYVDERQIAGVRFIGAPTHSPTNIPLGALRNLSIDSASGDVLCQWDDDDCSHPTRLSVQLEAMTKENAGASFLTDHLQFLEEDRVLLWIDWTLENPMDAEWQLFPGSLMMLRDSRFRYPESGPHARRGEDSAFLGQLLNRIPIARIGGHGHLYLYHFHGRNTFSKEHHYRLTTCRTSNDLLQARAETIRAAAAYYELARPVMVVGRQGPVFAIA